MGGGGLGQASSSHWNVPQEVGRGWEEGLVLRGGWHQSISQVGRVDQSLQFHRPRGPTPPPTFQTWPGNSSLLPPPPPPPCDCKRQQTLHGSFTLINQPDGQARMGPTGWWVSRPSPCPGPSPHLCPPQTPGVPAAPSHHLPRDSQDVPDSLRAPPNIQMGKLRHRTDRCVLRVSLEGCGEAVSGLQA